MSWWVPFRNAIEHIFVGAAKTAAPAMGAVLANAGGAIVAAVEKDGVEHGSKEAIDVALGSIQKDAPHLSLAMSTALAASVADELHQTNAQKATDPGQPPQTAG